MTRIRIAPYLFALALLGTSVASNANVFVVTDDELTPDAFPAVAQTIRDNLDGPQAPRGLTRARKQQVLHSLDRLEHYLNEDRDHHADRIREEQVRVNAALTPLVARDDGKSDTVCQRVKKVGTNIPVTECRSRADIERERQEGQSAADRMRQMQAMGDCSPGNPACPRL